MPDIVKSRTMLLMAFNTGDTSQSEWILKAVKMTQFLE
jgi:BarA-like signal transduction histidine kinase